MLLLCWTSKHCSSHPKFLFLWSHHSFAFSSIGRALTGHWTRSWLLHCWKWYWQSEFQMTAWTPFVPLLRRRLPTLGSHWISGRRSWTFVLPFLIWVNTTKALQRGLSWLTSTWSTWRNYKRRNKKSVQIEAVIVLMHQSTSSSVRIIAAQSKATRPDFALREKKDLDRCCLTFWTRSIQGFPDSSMHTCIPNWDPCLGRVAIRKNLDGLVSVTAF